MTVYSLTASDEPLQVRYVGATTGELETRFRGHVCDSHNVLKRAWMQAVAARGAEVEICPLSTHSTVDELLVAERRWLKFWGQYCDLFNLQVPMRIKPPRVRVAFSRSRSRKAVKIVKPRTDWTFMAGIEDRIILQAIEAERQYQARVTLTQGCDTVAQ